ncbi:MAG: 16S rRNA (cytosine(967)-C(5))-methyltransferase RsmB [Deltaproteobacteria bacterium]|nr:16S rRNA (cytosine(967)-C(5))-methyltransferase RsmB [Deltaproteobacteria bacterium]
MTRARDVALNVLVRVEQDRAFAAPALASELRGVNDPREAAFATELVLGVLRRRPFLDRLLDSASKRGLKKLDPRTMTILRLGAYQVAFLDNVPARAAVSETVSQVRRSRRQGLAGLANALLRNLAGMPPESLSPNEDDDGGPLQHAAVHLGLPAWILERLVLARGREGAFAAARAFNRPSRRTLRVNVNRATREQVLEKLGSSGVAGRLSPWSVDVSNPRAADELSRDGLAVHQDEGAQLAALALEPGPEDRVLDACAGRGGKTSALAMMTGNAAEITAVDRSSSKLERLVFELDRQGFEVTTMVADLAGKPVDLGGEFSRILLDAPCSGTGTLGRRPEIRWRLEPDAVASLVDVQSRLLESTSRLLAPGGRLVYAVCSVLPEEGTDHATSFLERHPDFHLTKTAPTSWPEEMPWAGGATIDPGGTATDGYQILSLEKGSHWKRGHWKRGQTRPIDI